MSVSCSRCRRSSTHAAQPGSCSRR
jgi:hypothetical protein